ncbi:hypothetical protein Cgig2_002038 [Carnegiea gigantea]|uniref:Uncharacterized protein n=1 Tax=Carnegiea gigantea TaxID=171969 RepID=A0A9Q1QD33_9CARY|nr:hypothetical protein Cgig2_002038 [Carnegiea gigantea]
MALDANNGHFLLAYGVVEKENKDNWAYFFRAFKQILVCNVYTKQVHKPALESIKRESIAGYEWLHMEPIEHWPRSIFDVVDGITPFTVDFNQRHWDYMVGDITSIPHKYEARCILGERPDIESFVHPTYIIKSYLHTYDVTMHPTKEHCPNYRDQKIRPQSERRRDATKLRKEYPRTNTYSSSKCKQYCHNSGSHRKGGVLEIKRCKDKPKKKKDEGHTRKLYLAKDLPT